MKQLFSLRSPFWQVVTVLITFPVFYLIAYMDEHDTASGAQLATSIYAVVLIVLTVMYWIATYRYNRTHPDNKISMSGFVPPEIKDEDEGMQMLTARATRKVYEYHAFALPFSAFAIVVLPHTVYVALTVLMVLSLGHYITYWRAIWPAFASSSEE